MSWRYEAEREAHATVLVPEVVGKQRPRTDTRGGKVRTYTPTKTTDAERDIASVFSAVNGNGMGDFEGPVVVEVEYARALKKSNPKKQVGRADLGKPDCDNVLKLVMDALTGVAYKEDRQVVRATVTKCARTPMESGDRISVRVIYLREEFE